MPRVLVLHGHDAFVQRLRESATDDVAVVRVDGWKALLRAASTAAPGSLVVADPFFPATEEPTARQPLARGLRDLRNHFPGIAVVAAWPIRPEHHEQLRRAGAWGVTDVVDLGILPPTNALRRRLARAHGIVPARVLPPDFLSFVPPDTRGLLTRALGVAMRGGLSAAWAREEGVSARTLLRTLEKQALPAPRRLLAWMRVLLASDLIDNPGHTISSVARASGFAAELPLRRAVENLVGVPMPEARRTGALRTALAAFAAELQGGGDSSERSGETPR